MPETCYEHRTDNVQEKLRLLEKAYGDENLDLAMSLCESVKDTLGLERQLRGVEDESVVDVARFGLVGQLPSVWAQWARGWKFYKVIALRENAGLERFYEPVDVPVAFAQDQIADVRREVRVARVRDEDRTVLEVPSQVYGVSHHNGESQCRIVFRADVPAKGRAHYLVFYGNPCAELPVYSTDLSVRGEGCGLDIENQHYVARLAGHTGQMERLIYSSRGLSAVDSPRNRQSSGLELLASGEGHGESPHIDWGHDYTDSNHFQKFRVTNWASCPNYEVVSGPLCIRVRRWGFPHSPAHPLFTPSRMHMDVTYTFYAGQPYFIKESRMEVIRDFELGAVRDDEWVFSGQPFTDSVWMDAEGLLHEGPVADGQQDNLWGVGFFNRHSRDAFISLRLEHSAENFDELDHGGAPHFDYQGIPRHAQLWSRYPARAGCFKAGVVLKQRNAYLVGQYDGPEKVQQMRRRLLQPLEASGAELPDKVTAAATEPLARRGETPETAPLKAAVWEALREVRDEMFYAVDANVVDMGYIYDVRIEGSVVHVLMTMPHRGRPKFGIIAGPLRERLLELEGVCEVIVDFTWEPAWSAACLTPKGREIMGLDPQ